MDQRRVEIGCFGRENHCDGGVGRLAVEPGAGKAGSGHKVSNGFHRALDASYELSLLDGLIAAVDDELAAGDAVERKRGAKFGEVLADAVDEPGVVVPDDDAVGRKNFECRFGVGFDALVGVAAVDEAEVGVGEKIGRGEGKGVAAELMDAVRGGVAEEGEAGGGAGEADPLLVAFAEGVDLGVGVLFGEIEGVDLGLGGVQGHGEGADAAEGSGLEDFPGAECADDGCEKGVGDDEAEAGEADGVDGREDDLARFVTAEKCGESRVIDDRKRVAGVEGVLANAAAKLDDVTPGGLCSRGERLPVQRDRGAWEGGAGNRLHSCASLGEAFLSSVAICFVKRAVRIFSYPMELSGREVLGKAGRLVESRCRCLLQPRLRLRFLPSTSL